MSILSCKFIVRSGIAAFVATALGALALVQAAEPAANNEPYATAIRATGQAFIQAFDRGDAKAIAGLWTENGSLAEDQGETFKGRKAIENAYATFFKEHPGARMEIAAQSIEFPAPAVAIETGLAQIVDKDGASPMSGRYTAVHVLQDGKWLMANVRDTKVSAPSNYAHLEPFEPLIGAWQAKSDSVLVRTTIRWVANRNFLRRNYSVQRDGLTTSSGVQIIGWDAQSQQVRSWSFDSSGGHGTGIWTATPDGWQIRSTGVLADGTPTSSLDFLVAAAAQDNIFGWRSTHRKAGGLDLPDLPETTLERVSEK